MSSAHPPKPTSRSSRFAHLAQFALEAIVAVLLLVTALWLLDVPTSSSYPAAHVKRLRYANQTHVFRDEGYSRYRVNSLGFLGNEPEPLIDRTVFRIAVFGDSLVESLQVPQDEKFTTLLERSLPVPKGYRKVEVWNLGFSGDNTGNAFARWVHLVREVPFDMVLFSFNDGDLLENRPQDPGASIGAFLVPGPKGSYVLDESRMEQPIGTVGRFVREHFGRPLYSLFLVRTRVTDFLHRKRAEWAHKPEGFKAWILGSGASRPTAAPQDGPALPPEAIAATVDQLKFVQGEIGRRTPIVLILGVPSSAVFDLPGAQANAQRRDGYREVVRQLVASGVPTIDPYAAVEAQVALGNDPFRAWEPGGHYNRKGHAIIAATILQAAGAAVSSAPSAKHAIQ
jgi:hypothetical protein